MSFLQESLAGEWNLLMKEESAKPYFQELSSFLHNEYNCSTVYPKREDIFNALKITPYESVKVVILGQDPYHGPNQAHGLSFSVNPGEKLPPSLKNMFKELEEDLGYPAPAHGFLKKWADQGVLLLNTVLTVREGEANSHKGRGWEQFTERVIGKLNERKRPIVFILWGNHAQTKRQLIDEKKHYIIASAHPSPLSARRGFFGSKPFSKANNFFKSIGEPEVDWKLQ